MQAAGPGSIKKSEISCAVCARKILSFPKIPSGMDSHRKAESSHPYP